MIELSGAVSMQDQQPNPARRFSAKVIAGLVVAAVICGGAIWLFVFLADVRDVAQRSDTLGNMHQVARAAKDAETVVPPENPRSAAPFDETKLSWRVRILPYLGEDELELYREFHLDERWNSPHNIKLLERMPRMFESPGADVPAGHTCFVRPVESRDMLKMSRNSDSQQLDAFCWLLEIPPELAVPWTRPDDLSISDPRIKPFRELGLPAFTAEPVLRFVQPDEATPEKLEELFTPPPDSVEK